MQLEQRKRALMMLLDNKVVWFLHNLDQVKGMTVVCRVYLARHGQRIVGHKQIEPRIEWATQIFFCVSSNRRRRRPRFQIMLHKPPEIPAERLF